MTTVRRGVEASRARPEERDRQLGEIAVFNKILTPEQLQECLDIRSAMAEQGFPMSLGKVLREKYYVDRMTLRALLRAQREMEGRSGGEPEDSVEIVKFTPREHETLVGRVQERKLLKPEEVDECFDIQVALEALGIDKLLGEIALEKGYLSRDAVGDILARHQTIRSTLVKEVVREPVAREVEPEPEKDEDVPEDSGLLAAVQDRVEPDSIRIARQFRFGRLAEEKGLATAEQVSEGLYIQFRMKELGIVRRLGEILVEKEFLRAPDVRRILGLQKQRLGKVRWSDIGKTKSWNREDLLLSELLARNGILSKDELDECRFVQKAMRDLGLKRDLAQVIVEKEYLDREVIDGIRKEQERRQDEEKKAKAEEGPVRVAAGQLKSLTLEKAYQEILQKMNLPEEGEGEEPEGRVELTDLAKKKTPQRAAVVHAGKSLSTKPAWAIAGSVAVLGGAVAIWFILGARRTTEEDRRSLEEKREAEERARSEWQVEVGTSIQAGQDRAANLAEARVSQVLALLTGPSFTPELFQSILIQAEKELADPEMAPYEADLRMAIGRAWFYRVATSPGDLAHGKGWTAKARESLSRAAELYGAPGARTAVADSKGDPSRSRLEVQRLLEELRNFEE
ncbi:MAG: hypothetical protein HY720_00920 [Planctomycetes bacterium]|nr:hypothetical protein [Planctomycetota bacterium]